MDDGDLLLNIAREGPGAYAPLVIIGVVVEDDTQDVSLRCVSDERLLKYLLANPKGRQWLHDGMDRLCDGLNPPDDQPKGVTYKHIVINGTGLSS